MSSPLSRSENHRYWAGGLLVCSIIVLSSGCGPDLKARAVVKGKVTTGKKSLTTGSVMFINKDGVSATASIEPDGSYEMKDAPLGECKITVTVQDLPMDPNVRARLKGKGPKMPEGPVNPEKSSPELPTSPKVPKEVVPIDAKYSKPETSGLSFTVKKGEQTYDIEL